MRFKSVISMTEEERKKYYEDKQREYIKPMLDKITQEDGTLDLEGLAYLLTELTEEMEEFREWRRS